MIRGNDITTARFFKKLTTVEEFRWAYYNRLQKSERVVYFRFPSIRGQTSHVSKRRKSEHRNDHIWAKKNCGNGKVFSDLHVLSRFQLVICSENFAENSHLCRKFIGSINFLIPYDIVAAFLEKIIPWIGDMWACAWFSRVSGMERWIPRFCSFELPQIHTQIHIQNKCRKYNQVNKYVQVHSGIQKILVFRCNFTVQTLS